MAGRRQPTELVVAKGKKHFSHAEEDARRDAEIHVPAPKKVTPPKWLPKALRAEFRALGSRLLAVGLYTELDADTLGRYLIAHHEWLAATEEVQGALNARPRDAEKVDTWGRVQERYFKQARNCAGDMGLTISSRCRLVLPTAAQSAGIGTEDEDDEFTAALRARQRRAECM